MRRGDESMSEPGKDGAVVAPETRANQYPERRSHRVAYIVLRFPTLSETFVVREINALRARGWQVDIFPLWRDHPEHIHADVPALEPFVHWAHPLHPATFAATMRMLIRRPKPYLSSLGLILREIPRRPKRALKSLGLFPIMVRMAAELEDSHTRHVHAHFASYPTLAALVIQRLTGISYSFTAHAFDLYVDPSHLATKVAEANFIVTISEYNHRLLQPLADGQTPVHVVHCGVDVPDRLPEQRPCSREILCVGRLEEKKGQRYLIEACRILRDRGQAFHCTIVGSGPERERLERQIADAGLGEYVELTGPLTAEYVQERLAAAEVFALPSVVTRNGNAEGIPVALMEAMAAGVPVISTRTTGIPELVIDGQTGLLVEPRDASALAEAIEHVLDDAELAERLRQSAFEKVRADFRLDENARAIEDHLLSVNQD